MHIRKIVIVASLALGLTATLSACGSSGSDGKTSTSTDPAQSFVAQAVKANGGWINEDEVRGLSAKKMCSEPKDEAAAVAEVSADLITIGNLAADKGLSDARADKAAEDAYRALFKKRCPSKLPILDKALKEFEG
ncbi:hypothetical protein [Streptomyces sp. CC224B]|uniref:hypothetical protein n=1 Tax=Streptomyces sp. CC224B TaxID=3044571 RepID=UPI0024A7D872|nr:hypothetical protein [Streptomyces sp. CC224B]